MYVTVTQSSDGSGHKVDKDAGEIKAAYEAGSSVFLVWDRNDLGKDDWQVIPLSAMDISANGNHYARFLNLNYSAVVDVDGDVDIAEVVFTSSQIAYNNSNSGLTSTNAQDAINEVQENVENVLPSGGTPGQLLTKTETGEEWADAPSGLPEGGTEGQILYRGANGAEWGDKPVMYVNITTSGAGFSADKTAQEIYEAVQKGFVVFAKLLGEQTIPLFQYTNNSSMFYKVAFDGGVLISISGSAVEIQGKDLKASCVSFTPTSTVTSDNVQDAIEEVYTKTAPTHQTITLYSSAWSSNTQTVTVSGVSATETAQLITPTPAIASQSAYYEAGIMCTNQGTNSLTFTCQTVPTSNLTVYVVIQPLG